MAYAGRRCLRAGCVRFQADSRPASSGEGMRVSEFAIVGIGGIDGEFLADAFDGC